MIPRNTLLQRCNAYLAEEPDEGLRSEIVELLAKNTESSRVELWDRLGHGLRFGTAGLRGRMEAGYNRLNLVTIYRFSHAMGSELLAPAKEPILVVMGYDARNNSHGFAQESAKILTAMGAKVFLFGREIPTPLCAYAAKVMRAQIGIMITASHNPKADNGIKLFDGLAAQIAGPLLKKIEEGMDAAPSRADFFRINERALAEFTPTLMGDDVFDRYLEEIEGTALFDASALDSRVAIVYTPLHGVGGRYFLKALSHAGFDQVELVAEQAEPNGDFPTVAYPNPEEEGALDRAEAVARDMGCDWIFAHDPDADRLQVSCRDRDGAYHRLSGNEMGAILGYFSLLRAIAKGKRPLLASSIVSSRMPMAMCLELNARYVDALTGFSNITEAALKAQKSSGHEYVFGYEEAIGFLIGTVVLDKDGINAGLRFMEVAAHLKRSDRTVWQLLDQLYARFGIFVSDQWSKRFFGNAAGLGMEEVMIRIRRTPPHDLAEAMGLDHIDKIDLNTDEGSSLYEGLRSDVIIFEKSDLRLLIRPSGTEPKIKFYMEAWERSDGPGTVSQKKAGLQVRISELKARVTNFLKL